MHESFVARVGKQEITPQEFRERIERLRSQARQQQGPNFDGSYFNDPTVKRQVLDRMIDEELLAKAARGAGAGATDASVRREIAGVKAFQVEGKFNPDQYRLLLQAQGIEENFEDDHSANVHERKPLEDQCTPPDPFIS